jgi:uncharacterized protein YfaS (alpha-2-macroglobulin family)
MIIRPGDTSRVTVSTFNATKKITSATLVFSIGTGTQMIQKSLDILLNPNEALSREFTFSAGAWS